MSNYSAERPWIEITRRYRRGPYRGMCRSYANIYRRPLRVWVLGRWIIGGAHVRRAWAEVERRA